MTALVLLLAPMAAPLDDDKVAALVADLRSTDPKKQLDAYTALTAAGPQAKSAVPALIKLLEDKTQRFDYAADVLGTIGPDAKAAVPALIARLPKEPGQFGFSSEHLASALARIDGPKIEATRALLLSTVKGGGLYLPASGTFHAHAPEMVKHLLVLSADKDPLVRQKAAAVFGVLKALEPAKVKLPTLYEKAGDSAKGIPAALERLLADENPEVQLAGAKAVVHVAPELTDKALAAVVHLAQNWPDTKKGELYAQDVFQPVPAKAAKVLIPLFDHEKDRVRMWAVNHVYALPVRAELEAVLKDGKSARAREAAAMALGACYTAAADALPALKDALKDPEFVVRFAAARAIVQIGRSENPASAAAVPVLVEGLQHTNEKVLSEASVALLQVGPAAKDAVPALKNLLDDKAPPVRFEAALALVGIDKTQAAGAVPALTEGLKSADARAGRAAKALGELGPVAKAAVPELVKRFDAKNLHVRLYSAGAAARIDPALAPKAVEVLVAILKDKKTQSSMLRSYGLVALRNIGPAAAPALPTLKTMLTDDGAFHPHAAVTMVMIGGDGASAAFDWVRTVLTKPNHDELYDLIEELPVLGPKAAPLVPDLIKLLAAKTPFHRRGAVEVLAAIGPGAKDALPELKKLAANDPRTDVRKLAAEAVAKIEAK